VTLVTYKLWCDFDKPNAFAFVENEWRGWCISCSVGQMVIAKSASLSPHVVFTGVTEWLENNEKN